MKINDQFGLERLQFFGKRIQALIKQKDPVQIRVRLHQLGILLFGHEADIRLRKLLPQHAHHGAGENNISNGTETDDENALHGNKCRKPKY